MLDRKDIIRVARSYVGTPFHHQGRVKGVGIDCVGLIVGICKELKIPHEDYTNYPRRPDGKTLDKYVRMSLDEIPLSNAGPGDVMTFLIGKYMGHVGLLTNYGLLHTHTQVGKVVEHLYSDEWKKRAWKAFAFRGAV